MRPKTLLILSLVGSLLIIAPVSAIAAEREFPLFDLRVGGWFSQADASWQISFPASGGGTTESELKYDDIDSNILLLEARIRPTLGFSLGLNLGAGTIDNAGYTDIDRTDGWVWSESQGNADGNVRLWGVTLYFHLLPEEEPNSAAWVNLFIGYQHYEDELRMFNGRQTISEKSSVPSVGPFSGLNSTYDFEWDYGQIGTQAGVSFVSNPRPGLYDLGLSASLALIPFLSYEGTGVWNLRSDLAQDPSFRHESNRGWGLDASLALNYSPYELVEMILGYRYLHLESQNGTDTTYNTDGSLSTANLDEVKLTRQGPFVSLSVRF